MSETYVPKVHLDLSVEHWEMVSPLQVAGYTMSALVVLVVNLRDGFHRGRGEATGRFYFNEGPAEMITAIEAVRERIEAGISREELRALMPPGGARNAVDCALWELESAKAGVPVWQLAGLELPTSLLTTCTIGAGLPEVMAKSAKELYPEASALKLKLLGDRKDADRVRAVRAARQDVWIGVDGNQGFTAESLNALLPTLIEADIQLIEQPCRIGDEAMLDGVQSPIPYAADESLQSLDDFDALAGRFQVVNIKLDKCGGLTEALMMADRAAKLGLEIMVGNMGGTSLAMAPAVLVGQLCNIVDLDGPLFLTADRKPGVTYSKGQVSLPSGVWGL